MRETGILARIVGQCRCSQAMPPNAQGRRPHEAAVGFGIHRVTRRRGGHGGRVCLPAARRAQSTAGSRANIKGGRIDPGRVGAGNGFQIKGWAVGQRLRQTEHQLTVIGDLPRRHPPNPTTGHRQRPLHLLCCRRWLHKFKHRPSRVPHTSAQERAQRGIGQTLGRCWLVHGRNSSINFHFVRLSCTKVQLGDSNVWYAAPWKGQAAAFHVTSSVQASGTPVKRTAPRGSLPFAGCLHLMQGKVRKL